jgi:hypothetical protein
MRELRGVLAAGVMGLALVLGSMALPARAFSDEASCGSGPCKCKVSNTDCDCQAENGACIASCASGGTSSCGYWPE